MGVWAVDHPTHIKSPLGWSHRPVFLPTLLREVPHNSHAFPGPMGHSPRVTACIVLVFLLGKNGRLPVKAWQVVIPKA